MATGYAVAQDDDDDDSRPAAEAVEPAEAPSEDGMTGNTQFFIGQAWLQDQWAPLDEPASFGFEVDFGPKKSLVHVALGFNIAFDEQTVPSTFFGETGDVGVGFAEFSAGFLVHPVRKAPVRPYIGAGIVRTFVGVGADWGLLERRRDRHDVRLLRQRGDLLQGRRRVQHRARRTHRARHGGHARRASRPTWTTSRRAC